MKTSGRGISRTSLLTLMLASSSVAFTTSGVARAGHSPALACDPWTVVPVSETDQGGLWGVSSTAANDVWAVGESGTAIAPLIYHWDGTAWSPARQVRTFGYLYGVEALSPTDAWAVGYRDTGNDTRALIEHWDGTGWSPVSVPAPGHGHWLFGVDALSPTDVWAVGFYTGANGVIHPLVEHFDGITWSPVPAPDGANLTNVLSAVSAISPDDVWAAGYYILPPFSIQPLIEHWDGRAWELIAPDPLPEGTTLNYLHDVDAASSSDVWAVGRWGESRGTQPLIEHWDGVSWTRTTLPRIQARIAALEGIAAIAGDDVWAVGGTAGDSAALLSMRWNGATWRRFGVPARYNAGLVDVFALSPSDIWAVGSQGSPLTPLALHANGGC